MPSKIRRLTTQQLVALLEAARPELKRSIDAVHLHHTWRPTQSQFKGQATIEGMRAFHMNTNGWDDIAQHLTIDPQGFSWTGRNWNLPPASQPGKNGTGASGPFMIEIVGDFDTGHDVLDGAQRLAVIDVVAAILGIWRLSPADIFFHNELGSSKTCPGTSVIKKELSREIQIALDATRATTRGDKKKGKKGSPAKQASAKTTVALPFAREFLLRSGVVAEAGAPAPNHQSWGVQEHDLSAREIEQNARSRVRASMQLPRDFATALERSNAKWDRLRPHVVNLTKGRLSQGGEFEMPADALDNIVAAIDQYARGTERPRVMMHAHGGLVSETSALSYALGSYTWWLDRGVFPVYFIWETSTFEIIKQRLGLSRGLGDWWDRRFERFARPVGKPLWSAMKESALLSSSIDADNGDAGGAWKFAKALAPVVKTPPPGKQISLHTVGHSAGAIFHAHYIPALIDHGLTIDSLAFLAPAIRSDLFKSQLLPRIHDGTVKRFEMYTMDEEAEKDDDLIEPIGIPIYGKSLLYLVSGAFEPEEKKADILGLEERFKNDAAVMALFPPGGQHRLEFSHAKGKPHNPATKARKHGCFDNDDATMQSVFTTITGTAAGTEFPASDDACVKASSRALDSVIVPPFPVVGRGAFPGIPTTLGASAPGMNGRALCVGIDSYATSPLAGCVRDAQAWETLLKSLHFDVTTLLEADATRQRVLDALGTLVRSARPGESIVFQYSGHGTQAEDQSGDESDWYDEALVPIDYQSGALLIDDDLANIYCELPAGAVLTLFMDCCHSGTNSRFAPIDRSEARGSERRRFLQLTSELQEAHRQYRSRVGSPRPASAEESLPGVIHFAACLDNQFAYESNGQGHFTRIATADLAAAVSRGATNEAFSNDVAAKVIGLGRPQTPRLMRLPADLSNRVVLGARASDASAPAAGDDRAMSEWCLQFFEAGASYWRQRVGR